MSIPSISFNPSAHAAKWTGERKDFESLETFVKRFMTMATCKLGDEFGRGDFVIHTTLGEVVTLRVPVGQYIVIHMGRISVMTDHELSIAMGGA